MISRKTDAAHELLSAQAVRDRSQRLMTLALGGNLADWVVRPDRLDATADFVASVVRERYPRLDVPMHSRWRHFVIGGRDLWADLVAAARWKDPETAARAAFDLAILSVLLDAGAGAGWSFHDRISGRTAGRSEGLALASLRWFEQGGLSDDPDDPFRVDAAALCRSDVPSLEHAFQVDDANPLLGLEGRAALLNRLGAVMGSRPDLFACADSPRPGGLFDALRKQSVQGRIPAGAILETLLEAFGPIWEGRAALGGVPLGDCWPHPELPASRPEESFVPLHKLSQWLAYSLIEPLEHAGIAVDGVQELTGLAEYRNGGLFVDMGVLELRDPGMSSKGFSVSDPVIVGWRSLTVALLDRIAPLVATRLGLAAGNLPLIKVLEGGTWAAGRLIARKTRPDGGPPYHIVSDGTVF